MREAIEKAYWLVTGYWQAMAVRALQEIPGLDTGIPEEWVTLIAIVLVVVGLLTAFFGRRVWREVMSFAGAVIGGVVGYSIGASMGDQIMGLVVATLCSMIGAAVMVFVAKIGIGAIAGVLAYVVVGAVLGSPVVGLIAAVIAFAVTLAYIDVAIGVVTAIVGGLLVGIGMLWLDLDMLLVVLGLLGVMVIGMAFQMVALKDETELKRRMRGVGASGPVAVAALSPPPPPAIPGRPCPRCNAEMKYMVEYNRYYCLRCQQYE